MLISVLLAITAAMAQRKEANQRVPFALNSGGVPFPDPLSPRVSGSYSFKMPDGKQRTVIYTADASGYRAEVMTNEIRPESST